MTAWVEDERRAAGPCPSCSAAAAVPVVYGYPDPVSCAELQDVVQFAGCCVPPEPVRWTCGSCGHGWGRAVFATGEPLEDPFADLDGTL